MCYQVRKAVEFPVLSIYGGEKEGEREREREREGGNILVKGMYVCVCGKKEMYGVLHRKGYKTRLV